MPHPTTLTPPRKFIVTLDQQLALALGGDKDGSLREALVLKQIHFLLEVKRKNPSKPTYQGHYQRGRWWVYNSLSEWKEEHFPSVSVRTLQRTLDSLRRKGVLMVEKLGPDKRDRTNWYAIDYKACERLGIPIRAEGEAIQPMQPRPEVPDWHVASCQSGTMGVRQSGTLHHAKLAPSLTEDSSEDSPETHTQTAIAAESPAATKATSRLVSELFSFGLSEKEAERTATQYPEGRIRFALQNPPAYQETSRRAGWLRGVLADGWILGVAPGKWLMSSGEDLDLLIDQHGREAVIREGEKRAGDAEQCGDTQRAARRWEMVRLLRAGLTGREACQPAAQPQGGDTKFKETHSGAVAPALPGERSLTRPYISKKYPPTSAPTAAGPVGPLPSSLMDRPGVPLQDQP